MVVREAVERTVGDLVGAIYSAVIKMGFVPLDGKLKRNIKNFSLKLGSWYLFLEEMSREMAPSGKLSL